jgi:hypothetical protein
MISAQLRGLAKNPATPPHLLIRLAAADIAAQDLLGRGDLPEQTAATHATCANVMVRASLARHPTLPPEVQAYLAADPQRQIRPQTAASPNHRRSCATIPSWS